MANPKKSDFYRTHKQVINEMIQSGDVAIQDLIKDHLQLKKKVKSDPGCTTLKQDKLLAKNKVVARINTYKEEQIAA